MRISSRRTIFGLLAFALLFSSAALWRWSHFRPSTPSPLAASITAPTPTHTPVATASPAPSGSEAQNRWPKAQPLTSAATLDFPHPDVIHGGRIVHTDFKPPLGRLEDTVNPDPQLGDKTLLSSQTLGDDISAADAVGSSFVDTDTSPHHSSTINLPNVVAPASGTVQVAESALPQLSVTLPATAQESFTWVSATLTLPSTTLSSLIVSLASSDPSELTVPATITVPAGQSSVTFTCTAIDDTRKDGAVTTTVTASAPGFISGSASVSLIDNDPSSGSWSLIPSPQPAGTQFSVTFTLRTVDGLVPRWSGNVPITALNAVGPAVLKDAPLTLVIKDGVGTATFAVLTAGSETKLRATMPTPASFTADSEPFSVSGGAFSSFTFTQIADPQMVDQPSVVTISAADAYGNPVPGYTGNAFLSIGNHPRVVGTGTTTTSALLYASGMNTRTQIIYKASELGGQGWIQGLALDVTSPAGATLNSLTIRIKPTSLQSYAAGAAWETTGWTTVYRNNSTVNETGWVEFPFTVPFIYNGTDNLLIDVSFQNSSSATSAVCRGGYPGGVRAITASGYGGYGSPLNWSGNTPAFSTSTWVPNVRLSMKSVGGAVSPSYIGPFTAGTWTGPLTFTAPGGPLTLSAAIHPVKSSSKIFTILPRPPTLDPEPPVTGGTSNTLSWTPGLVTQTHLLQMATTAEFNDPVTSPPVTGPSHTVSSVEEGSRFYRVKQRATVPISLDVFGVSHPPALDGTQFDSISGSVTLALAETITTESFDAPGTAWSDTIFTEVGGDLTRSALGEGTGPSTTPALPVNQGGDLEAVFNSAYASGHALRPASTAFTNGSIEAIVAPANPAAEASTSALVLRGVLSGATLDRGYAAVISFNSNYTAKVDFVKYVSGKAYQFNTTTSSFPVSTSENIRARFSIMGSQLSLSLWRLTVSGGAIQETPINFASGANTLVATDTFHSSPGVAGLRFTATAQLVRLLFDDVTVTDRSDYLASGTVTSTEIVPLRLHRWGSLTYSADRPAGTSLTVDVLSSTGAVLVTDVPSGADLGEFPALADQPTLRIRASLATTNPSVTPHINWKGWTLTYHALPSQIYDSAWSPTVSSHQDATAPTLAITSPTLTDTPSYTLAGTAADANGVASVSVNGLVASTANGFIGWSRALTLHPGANTFTLTAADPASPANTRTTEFTVTYTPPDADSDGMPDSWESAHGLEPGSTTGDNGPRGDPDRDGLPNLLEYAFGLSPRATESTLPYSVQHVLDPETAQPALALSYRRLIYPGALTYTVVTSTNLTTWTPVATPTQPVSVTPNADGLTETVVVRIPIGNPRTFVRIEVGAP